MVDKHASRIGAIKIILLLATNKCPIVAAGPTDGDASRRGGGSAPYAGSGGRGRGTDKRQPGRGGGGKRTEEAGRSSASTTKKEKPLPTSIDEMPKLEDKTSKVCRKDVHRFP